MISLDQILLLEQKVERAVEKITQLQAENDALRRKCSELTNALSSKTEQISSFEQDQNKIENGILKALERLNSIENSVLKAASEPAPAVKAVAEKEQQKLPAEAVHMQSAPSIPVQNVVPAPDEKTTDNSGQFDIF
jgi:FtsZ-binding cell division protein ZapB